MVNKKCKTSHSLSKRAKRPIASAMQTPAPPPVTRSEANKYKNFAARMRTDMELSRKSKKIPEYYATAIEQEIAHILVQRNIIYPQSLERLGINKDSTYQERKEIFDIQSYKPQMTYGLKKFINFMRDSQQNANKAKWRFRIAEEAQQKQKEGWYPFFVTITVDPKIIDSKEMWKSGKQWQKLVKSLSKIASDKLGHPPFWKKNKLFNYRSITDYLTYAAVIEHGKSREHHHLHAIIWLKDVPESWKLCPNRNSRGINKIHNRCRPLETYWKLGRCEVNYFRSVGDIWEIKHKFCIPLKEGKPMKVAPVNVAGAYLTKYLQKEHKEWNHRMKATRNLGMTRLKNLIRQLPGEIVEALTWRPHSPRLSLGLNQTHTVPLGLLRQEAISQNFYHQYKHEKLDLIKLMMVPSKPYIKMLRSVQNGLRPDRMHFEEFFDWLNQFLPVQKGYCEKMLEASHNIIGEHFPRIYKKVQPIKIGANEI